MPLYQDLYTVSARFFESVQIFVFVLLMIICFLLLILMVIHINSGKKSKKKKRLVISIGKAIKEVSATTSTEESINAFITKNKIFTRRGLAALSEVIGYMENKDKKKVREILLKMHCDKDLVKQLKSDNEDYLAEIIRLAAELNLVDLVGDIEWVMMAHPDNSNVQYEAFLALAKLGSSESIINICTMKDFSTALTFRSLQEIISSFTGDKAALYKALLASPDAYVVRICVKLIGSENMIDLAPDIEKFLDSGNMNLLIDTMRALSNLRYKPVVYKLVTLMKNDNWEVRSVAVNAVAAIDTQGHIDDFIEALQDSEWQVRYNAGSALSILKDRKDIYDKVLASGDNFAIDMFENFSQMAEIRRV